MGFAGPFGHLPGVRPSCGNRPSGCHCTWALDVETLPLVTRPWRDLLSRLLPCLPCWVGLLWPRVGVWVWVRVCGCVGVCVGVCRCVCVWVPAGLLAGVSIPSCSHVLMKEPRKVFKLHTRRVFIMDDCDELIPRKFQYDTVSSCACIVSSPWRTVTGWPQTGLNLAWFSTCKCAASST